jgi:UDP-galactopyranose mutase
MRLSGAVSGSVHENSGSARVDLVCFSHLRWDFVFQRPQHLLTRAARTMRVLFWEEPIPTTATQPSVDRRLTNEGVIVLQPRIPENQDWIAAQRTLLDQILREFAVNSPVLWFYTPQAQAFAGHLQGNPAIYDCMDELSAFAGADPALPEWERNLMARAALVFTGGRSLHEAKSRQHGNVHAFPSGVETAHFQPARGGLPDPRDQQAIPHPRMGFYGVLDERLDRDLLARVADLRPDTHFVLVGPLAKLDLEELPQRPNLHYLGAKDYSELPAYVANWDVALMPFAINEATRFISPTKTPEYLAAGRPVVSTPIVDVVRQYGAMPAVQIAGTAEAFAAATDAALALARGPRDWLAEADAMLAGMSWEAIWSAMSGLILNERQAPPRKASPGAQYDVLIVGAGFAGSVLAERLAAGSGKRVLLIDRRPHIGGNAYDQHDAAGVLIHPYGPHIFHTNSQAILDHLSRFTEWRPYEHRVLAQVRGMELPMPINRQTVNRFFGVDLTQDEVEAFLESKAEHPGTIRTSADVVLSKVGRELYEAFFQGYTRKQWGLDPSELDKSVTSRVPTRTSDDDRYFTDQHQQMPLHGYTRMFERMLDHPGIHLALGTDYKDIDPACYDQLIFTGPIDEFFGHRYGKLPYRSLQFRHETHDRPQFQDVGVVNYPAESVPFTRITEFKYLTGQEHPQTSVCYEYPSAEGDPYYPVPRPENAALYQRYQALADATPNVTFVGRLATYKYYNMDQVVGQALATYQRLAAKERVLDQDTATQVPAAAE